MTSFYKIRLKTITDYIKLLLQIFNIAALVSYNYCRLLQITFKIITNYAKSYYIL